MKYLFFIFIIFYSCKKNNSLRVENEKESGSTISLRNFKRDAFNDKGKLLWVLKSEEAFVYVKENKSIFYKLDFDEYKEGKISSELKSDRGMIDQKEKKLILTGNIILTTSDKKILKTEELFYDLNEEKLSTEKEVQIIMKGTSIRGIGLSADKGLNSISIFKPIGTSSDNPISKE